MQAVRSIAILEPTPREAAPIRTDDIAAFEASVEEAAASTDKRSDRRRLEQEPSDSASPIDGQADAAATQPPPAPVLTLPYPLTAIASSAGALDAKAPQAALAATPDVAGLVANTAPTAAPAALWNAALTSAAPEQAAQLQAAATPTSPTPLSMSQSPLAYTQPPSLPAAAAANPAAFAAATAEMQEIVAPIAAAGPRDLNTRAPIDAKKGDAGAMLRDVGQPAPALTAQGTGTQSVPTSSAPAPEAGSASTAASASQIDTLTPQDIGGAAPVAPTGVQRQNPTIRSGGAGKPDASANGAAHARVESPTPVTGRGSAVDNLALNTGLSFASTPGEDAAVASYSTGAAPPFNAAPNATPQTVMQTASAATVTAPTAARPMSAHQQVANQIIRQVSDQGAQFTVRLDPPALGRVDVRLQVGKDRSVSALISADQPATLTELARASRELERMLEQSGLAVANDGLQFSLRQDGGPGNNGGDKPELGAHDQAAPSDNTATEQQPAKPARPFGLETWRVGRVDLVA